MEFDDLVDRVVTSFFTTEEIKELETKDKHNDLFWITRAEAEILHKHLKHEFIDRDQYWEKWEFLKRMREFLDAK